MRPALYALEISLHPSELLVTFSLPFRNSHIEIIYRSLRDSFWCCPIGKLGFTNVAHRQSCLRCLKTGRTCRGYENNGDLIFRQHEAQQNKSSPFQLPFKSTARKCSLPARVPAPGSDIVPEDGPPKEVSESVIEDCALRAFFHDYCVVPMNSSLSRGFLGGLELMVHRLGLQSQVANACKAVAFASHGLKLSRPFLTRKAEMLYHDLLGSLARSIQNPDVASSSETMVISILLGLYEVLFVSFEDISLGINDPLALQ